MKDKLQFQEIKRWLKTSLKNKVSVNNKTIITYLMLGLVGVSNIVFSAWTWKEAIWADGDHNKRMALLNSKNIAGDGSILLTDEIKKKDENGKLTSTNISSLENSVIIGLGGATGSQKVDIQVEGGARGLVGIGNIGIYSNPHNTGRTGTGGQAVAIGDNVTSTSQAVAIGNETFAIGNASIAIGSDDIKSYSTTMISNHVYDNYLKPLYNNIDPNGSRFRRTYYSPNVAGGTGSISIGSRTLAFKDGATALGTLAFALGKSSTALGAESFAEGEGSIAIGNKTRNFADQALAIGNDSQIRYKGGTAIGLKAKSAGEGAIAIGTEVYSNVAINNNIRSVKNKSINEIENYLNNLNANTINYHDIDWIVKNTNDGSKNLAKNAIAIGTKSAAVGDNSIVLGRGSFAFAKNSFALGSYSYAEAENGAAIGIGAKSISYENSDNRNNDNYMHNGKNAMAIGNGALATLENSISIGVNSKTDYSYNELLKPGWLPNGATSIPSSGKTGVISVGSKGFERRLVNLAPGYRGTDAVNVDQLKSFENRLENKQYDSGFTIQYISVEKTKGKAKEISDKLKLNSEYIEYIDLREQLELIKARHKFKDEEIVTETKTKIEKRIAELEKNTLIKTTAGEMGTYTSDSLATGTSEQDKENNFKAFYNTLEAKKKEALKEETKKPLFGNKLLKDVLANTNYNNDGATGKDAMAFGYRTEASGEAAIAIGAPSNPAGSTSNDVITKATGLRGIAIGAGAVNTGEYSVALGSNSNVTGKEGIAIGDRAEATLEKSVAIGSGSTVTATSGDGYLTKQAAPEKSGMVVSVGGRRIQNLKDGAKDDEAVTVAQLKKLKEQTLTRDNAKIKIATDENGTQEFTIGSTINLKTNDAWGENNEKFVGENIETYKKDDGTILIGVKENPKFKTLILNNKEKSATDLILSSNKNGDLSLGNKKIINVGEGSISSNSTDVVIGKQLKATEDKIETLKGNALTKTEASATYITKTEAGNTYVTKTEVGNTKLKYAANTDKAKEVSLNTGLKFTNGTNTTAVVENNGVVKFNLNSTLTGITSITAGENKAKLTFGDNDITVNSKKITGLVDATLSDSSTDAVTGKQLKATEDKVTTLNTKVGTIESNVTTLTNKGIKFKGDTGSDITTKLGETLNIKGDDSSITTNSSGSIIKISVKDGGISKEKLSNDLKTTINNSLSKSDADNTYAKKDASNIDETKYISKLNTGASIATPKEKLVKDSDVKNYLTTNYITKTEVESKVNASKTIVEASTGSPITVSPSTSGSANKYTIGIDSDKLKEIAGTKEKGNVTSTDINVTNGNGRLIGNTELKLSIKNGAITKEKLENDLKTKIEKIADDANGTYATKTELNSKANKDATNLSKAEITKWKEKLGVTNIDLSYKAGADTVAKTTTLSNGLHFKSDGGNLSVKSEDGGVITYTINQTDSINKNAGTTGNTNKLTTEKAVKDYVASEIAGINTTVGNATLTLSKDGTEETSKINLKTDKLTVKGTNGIDVSISSGKDKAITLKLDSDTKNKIDGALSKTEASTTYITKTEAGNTYVTKTEVSDTKLKYAANTDTAKEVSLSSGLKFTNGTNTTAEIGENGVVKFNLNTDLTGITSITAGNNKAKLTIGDNITVNSKKITGLADAELSDSSTDAVTGKQLKATNTNVTNLTTKVGTIESNITNLTSGGIKFKGNDNTEITTALGSTLNLVGEGVNSSDTFNSASGNIKVEKGTSTDKLIFKLSKDLKNIKSIELKEGDKTSTLTINNAGKVTIGGNEVVTTNNIGSQTIGYKANSTGDKTTTLTSGFNFLNGTNTTAEIGENGVVKFNLNTDLTGITSITAGNNKAKLTLGDDNISLNDKKLTGLVDAELSDSSTDAVTGKQLKATNTNVTNLTTKVENITNNITNGEAGTVIFTNENGDRLYKGNDGKYYLKDQLNDNGTPKTGFEDKGIANPELRLVNADGTTTKATTLNNLANGLAGITRDTDKPITPEKAKEVITALLTQTTDLNKAVNIGDLQALAQAGLDFSGNTGVVTLHRALGTKLQIAGEGTSGDNFVGASDNINVKAIEDATNKISKLEIQLAKALKNIESIQNGDTKITLDKDKSNVEIANGDKAKTTINEKGIKVIGKDGKDAVTLSGTDGTNGASVIVKGKDGADGVTIKGGNGTDAPTISFVTKDNKGTGTITGLKDPDGNDKTAATTVNYVTNEIAKATTSLTDKGLKFVGNDGNEVTKKLGEKLSIKGEGVSSSDTFNSASGNIKVSKGTDGLEIGLSKNLKNIETIELKGKDGVNGTIGIFKDGLTLTKDSKTTKILTEANIGDQKIKYKANNGTSKEVKLSDGFNFTNGENTTSEIGDNGVVKVNVNSKLNNIESIAAKDPVKGIEITNGDKAKTTINEDGIKVIGKDGKDAVTVNGTDGTNGASVIVKGKDGADGVTIRGGNETDAPSIDFAKKTENGNTIGTGTITGLKDPDGNDKTAATTVNYVTNEIAKATTSLTDKGLKFVGNDGNEITKKLGETLSIKGEGVSSSDTFNSASGNIKVSNKADGLEIGLSKNLKNIETIELKGKDGVNGTIGISKDGLTLTKDSKTTKILTEANIGDQKIKYKANNGTSKEIKLSDGFNFTNGENTTAEIGDNGVVKVNVNSTLNKMKAINFENGKITGLATPDGRDLTSAANVAYVNKKVSNAEFLSSKALSGVSNAVAMANLPQITANSEYNSGIGISYGTYNGENSFAFGLSGVNNSENFLYRASASLNTKGNVAFGIGFGYQLGKKKVILENSKLIKLEEKFNNIKRENEANKSKVSELEVIVKEISNENDKLRKKINEKEVQNEDRITKLEEKNKEMKDYLEQLLLENKKNKEMLEKLLKKGKRK